ncbi:hypothetical protein C3489_37555 [Streptomyces sp. Ru71]|nr:hypothetical protein C3489_37555 [Streptomyces sp. Ru71]
MPTELLGRARKTLHGCPPFAQIRFPPPERDAPRPPPTGPRGPCGPRPYALADGPHRYDYCAPP